MPRSWTAAAPAGRHRRPGSRPACWPSTPSWSAPPRTALSAADRHSAAPPQVQKGFSDSMADCPFCQDNTDIAVLESRDWLAIYNRSPLTTGHCLVIPRQHVATLTALSRSEVASFFAFAADVNRLVLAACNTDQFDWALQQG